MKKTITLFLLLSIIGFVCSQTTTKQKPIISKDSIKKSKTNLIPQVVNTDTLQFEFENYKFYKKNAHASYYADKFHGKKTASGKKFDMNKMTAAHKKLPFGTILKITNEANGKSVIVEVNDRGPFVRSREIDLSKRAFMEIAQNSSGGQMKVTIEVAEK